MDRKLTEEFTQALRTLEAAERHTREAQETVNLLRSRWNAELRVGDIVGDLYDGKCEVAKIADDTIELKMIDGKRNETLRKHTPIQRATIYPWTDSDEKKHQLDVRRRALVNQLYHLPAEDVARIEEALKSS
jgi:hypothetical protein